MLIVATSAGATPPPATAQENPVSQGINQFGLDLYQKLAAAKGNVFFSPASISTAMAMAYAGAKGQTAGQIAAVMHFDQSPDKLNADFAQMLRAWNAGKKDYQLAVANAMWGQQGYPFLPSFNDLLQHDYGASIREVDFARSEEARQTINKWVEQQTKGKITELIPSGGVNAMTRLVLTNAIYFKAAWDHPFQPRMTHPMPFHQSSGQTTPVPMMSQSAGFRYWKGPDFAALDMPYAHDQLSMLVFLPEAADGLPQLEKSLTPQKLQGWTDQLLRQRASEVRVSFPKFKMTQEVALAGMLSQMGMPLAFSGQADYSGMNAGTERISIGEVFHKAYVDVNEEGTEAAAATGIVMQATAMPFAPAVFVADHPFLFVIRDNHSGSILFMGRVENPNS